MNKEEKKSEIHITNNFNAPIGQHINHVDTINFKMDGDGQFHFGMVDHVNGRSVSDNDDDEGTDIEQKVLKAICTLKEEKLLKHKYDYTWVMEVMNQTKDLPTFNTPNSFITFLEGLVIEDLPSEDSITKKQSVFTGRFPDWIFTDCDTTETTRRINVARRFLNVYRSK